MARRILAAAAALLLLTAACGDDDDGSAPDPDATTGDATTGDDSPDEEGPDTAGDGLSISGSTFQLAPVEAGSEVTVANQDGIPHTLTADDDSFTTGQIAGGSSATFIAPDEAGDYPVHCEVHPTMTATLEVT